jgi:hypothetical protein
MLVENNGIAGIVQQSTHDKTCYSLPLLTRSKCRNVSGLRRNNNSAYFWVENNAPNIVLVVIVFILSSRDSLTGWLRNSQRPFNFIEVANRGELKSKFVFSIS